MTLLMVCGIKDCIMKYFTAQKHIINKAFVGVVDISKVSFMTLVVL